MTRVQAGGRRRAWALVGGLALGAVGMAVAGPAPATPAPAAPQPMAPDAAQLARGQPIYARCAGCHAIEGHRTGPQHCGLFGRRSGTAPGFDGYSPAMKASGIVWDERTLQRFLKDPPATVPGTSMGYAGVKDDGERAALIAWLRSRLHAQVTHCSAFDSYQRLLQKRWRHFWFEVRLVPWRRL